MPNLLVDRLAVANGLGNCHTHFSGQLAIAEDLGKCRIYRLTIWQLPRAWAIAEFIG